MVKNWIKGACLCITCFALIGCKPLVTADIEAKAKIASPEIVAKIAEDIKTELRSDIKLEVKKEVKREVTSTVGSMSTEKGINIGSVSLEGGAVVAIVVLLIVAVVVIKKMKTSDKTVQLLAATLETRINDNDKRSIRRNAKKLGVQDYLDKQVDKANNGKFHLYSDGKKVSF